MGTHGVTFELVLSHVEIAGNEEAEADKLAEQGRPRGPAMFGLQELQMVQIETYQVSCQTHQGNSFNRCIRVKVEKGTNKQG